MQLAISRRKETKIVPAELDELTTSELRQYIASVDACGQHAYKSYHLA